jgi:hypothetical protein
MRRKINTKFMEFKRIIGETVKMETNIAKD